MVGDDLEPLDEYYCGATIGCARLPRSLKSRRAGLQASPVGAELIHPNAALERAQLAAQEP